MKTTYYFLSLSDSVKHRLMSRLGYNIQVTLRGHVLRKLRPSTSLGFEGNYCFESNYYDKFRAIIDYVKPEYIGLCEVKRRCWA